jgi:membrane carboxypeptidase/penicillin-binding protein
VASRELAERRRSYVLRRMFELGFIDEEEQRFALATPVSGELHGPRVEVDAPWAAELVRQAALAEYGERAYTDGLRVVTTIDSRLQRAADVALRSAVLEYDRRHGYRGVAGTASLPAVEGPADVEAALQRFPTVGGLLPAVVLAVDASAARVATRSRGEFDIPFDNMRWARPATAPGAVGPAPRRPADVLARGDVVYVLPEQAGRALLVQVPAAQGALVAVDPQDGAIVAMSGGFDFYATSFNRATQAKRQPGSAFKPFIYSAALDSGITPASLVLDAPVVYEAEETGSGQDWRPQNVDARFYGPTRLRDALARSRNLVSVRVMRSIGVGPTLDFVQNFGFARSQLPDNLTTALGTAQVTPLEMAAGYAVFANGGQRVEPYLIERVEDTAGAVLSQAAPVLACPECGSEAGYDLATRHGRARGRQRRHPRRGGGRRAAGGATGAARAAGDQRRQRLRDDRHDARRHPGRHREAGACARPRRPGRQDRHHQRPPRRLVRRLQRRARGRELGRLRPGAVPGQPRGRWPHGAADVGLLHARGAARPAGAAPAHAGGRGHRAGIARDGGARLARRPRRVLRVLPGGASAGRGGGSGRTGRHGHGATRGAAVLRARREEVQRWRSVHRGPTCCATRWPAKPPGS